MDALAPDVGGEFVPMSTERGKYYRLDPTGSEWRRIDHPATIDTPCSTRATDNEGDAVAIERDVMALPEKLETHDLLEPGAAR